MNDLTEVAPVWLKVPDRPGEWLRLSADGLVSLPRTVYRTAPGILTTWDNYGFFGWEPIKPTPGVWWFPVSSQQG